jgi:hypothetical protein
MIKIIGKYKYWLSDESKQIGDWVISKNNINQQIDNSDQYMNHVFNKPFEIGIGKCREDSSVYPPRLIADNIVLAGDALQKGCYKIIKTTNPNLKFS